MSESAKKKMKQTRLPFAIIASEPGKDASPKAVDKSPMPLVSRKRKPSNDGDNARSNKIGRVTDSKENIAAKDFLEILDSDEDIADVSINEKIVEKADVAGTTPTVAPENQLHIKLPSTTKSKRKINLEVKPAFDADDSVVYLEEMNIGRKAKKSEKKKKKKRAESSSDETEREKKTLKLEEPIEEKCEEDDVVEIVEEEDDVVEIVEEDEILSAPEDSDEEVEKKVVLSDDFKTGEEDPTAEVKKPEEKIPDNSDKIQTIPSNSSSPGGQYPEEIQDELIEMLSDGSDSSLKNSKSPDNNDEGKTPKSSKFDITKLTPKQLARRQELESRRNEKDLQRQKEREQKELQRVKEKEQREEAKRKEKEEKEEARRKEKEERDRKRQAEQDKKDEEKRQKEEERKRIVDQRDEEKRQKEEERKRQVEQREEEKRKREEAQKKKEEEEENRKKRAAENFSKFFKVSTKKKAEAATFDDEMSKDSAESAESGKLIKSNFMPFQVREGMKLAPLVRLQISNEQKISLEKNLKTDKPLSNLYLNQLRKGLHKPGSSGKTWPKNDDDDDDDVITIDELEGVGEDIQPEENKIKMKYRAKYLMFTENRRPAYYGTWRKQSKNITARHPFSQDQFLDYEVDSDDEWEEEEPGESLHGSDSEKEKDADAEEYEVDNDFFVPHGHLSDEEMQQDQDEDLENNHPEAQKAKLKILQQEFAAEMKKKTEKIKPRLIGCIWMNGDEDEFGCSKIGNLEKKYHCSDIIWRILKAREIMVSEDGVKLEDDLEPIVAEAETDVEKTPAHTKTQLRAKFNDESIKELIRLVHGNLNSKKFIIREFNAYRLKNYGQKDLESYLEFSRKSVDDKMMEICIYKTCPEEGPMFGKKCWLVKPDVMQEFFGDDKVKLPNAWTYILEKEVKEKKPKQPSINEGAKKEDSPVEAKPEIVVEDKPKVVEKPKPTTPKPPTPSPSVTKKRVQLLMSVPCGQEIPLTKKNNLISQYLKGNQQKSDESKSEVIEIDD